MRPGRPALLTVLALLALAAALLLAIQLTGDAAIVDYAQPIDNNVSEAPLEPRRTIGQTFVARHDGLAGIELYLTPVNGSALALTLHLRADPGAGVDLATVVESIPPGAGPGYVRFAFPAVQDSNGRYFYAFLDASAPGIAVPLTEGETYFDGAAYQAHQPLDAQTGFRLVYEWQSSIWGLVRSAWGWLGLLAAAALLYIVPGWAVLAWVLPNGRLNWAERLGLAVGTSLIFYPLLLLWTHLVRLHLGPIYAWLPSLAGVGALVWRARLWRPGQTRDTLRQWLHSDALVPDLLLLAVIGLLLGTRLPVVGSLETPLWGDGYQHTLITQLIVDNGGLFQSWAPYAELETFTYHFGLHGAAAAFHWFTGLPVTQAVLWSTQILNALAVLALYPLATRMTGSRWAGVWAVLMAGLLTQMPMSYTNWGRFTQLAGLAILPGAVWLTWEAVDVRQRRWRLLALAALLAGGLALTHFRVLIFYIVFSMSLLLFSWRRRPVEVLIRLGCVGVAAGVLFAPWFVNAFGGDVLRIFGYQITTAPAQATAFDLQNNEAGNLATYLAPTWWLCMFLGVGTGLWKRQRGVLLMALWWLLLVLVTNPAWFNLPGSGAITNFALLISIYLPASLFTAVLVVPVLGPLLRRKWPAAVVALLLVGWASWGAWQRLGDLDSYGALVTRPDVQAAAWIRDNTPGDARFLVNSFPAYGGALVVGSDGGWWLPLLAGRQATVPPLNYGNERGPDPGYRTRVNELSQLVRERGLADPAVLDTLRRQKLTHVYVGQRQGRVNYDGPDVLDPAELQTNPRLTTVYHRDRTWIFEIKP